MNWRAIGCLVMGALALISAAAVAIEWLLELSNPTRSPRDERPKR